MSSGWDTDQLVQAMLLSEKNRVTKAYQAVAKMEFKRDAYKSVNSLVSNFNNTFLSVAGSKSVKSVETFRAYSVKMDSNTGVKVTASTDANVGNYNISVQNIATGASVQSSRAIDSSFNANTKLADSGLDFVTVDENSSITVNLKNGEGEAKIVLNPNETIGGLVKKINSAGLGITATISEITGKFTMTSNKTGIASSLELEQEAYDANGDSVDVFGILGFDVSNPTAGQDAEYTINGYTHTSSLNKFSIDGLHIDLSGQTSGTINFSVEKDNSHAMDTIKSFVENLNTLYQTLYSLSNEKQYRSYQPLTPDERSALNENDAAKWDAKAKSGIIRKDNMIESLLSEVRMAFLQKVPGSDLTFADIGITTNSFTERAAGEGASWIIDEAKLQKALAENPDAVEKMFVKDSSSYSEAGMAARLNIAVNNYNTKIRESGYRDLDFEKKIVDLNTVMARANVKFSAKQEAAYAKLAAMESALSKLQSQSSWLMSQIGG